MLRKIVSNSPAAKIIAMLGVGLFLTGLLFLTPEKSAAAGLTYRSVDVMKMTKDVIRSQQSDQEIQNIVNTIVDNINPTHIAISVPLDATADFNSNNRPSPRTIEQFTQKWVDAIHARGVKVIFRGTWSGIEGIYDFPKRQGTTRFLSGTAATVVADGHSTWLGKTYKYIIDHPTYFQPGDVWAVLPERTEGIFSNSTAFLPGTNGMQANYATFFNDLKTVSDQAFAQIGVGVTTGLTANNFTEINSGWMFGSVLDAAGMIVIDHYGSNHTPEEMDADIRRIARIRGKQVFLQEWGDYWNAGQNAATREVYLNRMYAVFQKLIDDNILIGFNYWGGWDGDLEGILTKTGPGTYGVNNRGRILGNFFAANAAGAQPTPPPPPPAGPAIGNGTGLTGAYFHNRNFTNLSLTRIDSTIDFNWSTLSPNRRIYPSTYSVRWTGQIMPAYSETYTFYASSDDGLRLWVNNHPISDNWHDRSNTENSATIALQAGQRYDIKIEYYQKYGTASVKLAWSSPSQAKQTVPRSQLFPTANILGIKAYANGTLVKGQGPTVYIIEVGRLRGFVSEHAFLFQGFRFSDVVVVSEQDLQSVPVGPPIH